MAYKIYKPISNFLFPIDSIIKDALGLKYKVLDYMNFEIINKKLIRFDSITKKYIINSAKFECIDDYSKIYGLSAIITSNKNIDGYNMKFEAYMDFKDSEIEHYFLYDIEGKYTFIASKSSTEDSNTLI